MATLDLSRATQRIDMHDGDLGIHGAGDGSGPTGWSYVTPAGHDVQFTGTGITFNAAGRAVSGTVHSIAVDLGNNDVASPDFVISGFSAAVTTFSPQRGLGRVLEGNDRIIGPNAPNLGATSIFGDAVRADTGTSYGGRDEFELGNAQVDVSGDVWTVGSNATGTPTSNYIGGSDTILGQMTGQRQNLIGDAFEVFATGTLTGGEDIISIATSDTGSIAIGDALMVKGIAGDLATVTGGNDLITAGSQTSAMLVGDVGVQSTYSFVRGGNDIISGGNLGQYIVGDVYIVDNNKMVGGADRISGGAGNDRIFGDYYQLGALGKVTAGNDTIHGGGGEDYIYGDGGDSARTTGGNDRLFGETGLDTLVGGTGNDFLDGGLDDDTMRGGAGNDVYVVDSVADFIGEVANEGIDIVRVVNDLFTLTDNVENLIYIGNGRTEVTGNGLNNTMRGGAAGDLLQGADGNDHVYGGAGDDQLYDGSGNDVLNGGSGADSIDGSSGFDIASYKGSEHAVVVSLDGSVATTGDAVGDLLQDIEGLQGTDFNDLLIGDANANRLYGDGGNDTLIGGRGTDVLFGGAGNDIYVLDELADSISDTSGIDTITSLVSFSLVGHTSIERLVLRGGDAIAGVGNGLANALVGNSAANRLSGAAGNDVITGGYGNDVLVGGAGNDSFVFNAGLSRSGNLDVISNFRNAAGNNDTIRLDNAIFAKLGATGALKAAFFHLGAKAVDGNDHILYNKATGALSYDADGSGSGAAIQFATLSNHITLTATDFLVI